MSAQSFSLERPRRIFLLAHGAVITDRELHREDPNLRINFYTPQGHYLEKMLIPGIFQFFNSPHKLKLLIKSQPNAQIYDGIELPLTDADMEHALFLQPDDDMRLFPKCTNAVMDVDDSMRPVRVQVWNDGDVPQYSIDKFLKTENIFPQLKYLIENVEVEIYKINDKASGLYGDWILKLKSTETKALFLSSIIAWLSGIFKNQCPEIHWIACREPLTMAQLQQELISNK